MGTTATTFMVEDLNQEGSSDPGELVWEGNYLFFTGEIDGDEGLLVLTDGPQSTAFDPQFTFLSNDTTDPRPLSLSGGSMYFREAGNDLLHWEPGMELGTVEVHHALGWENLEVVSDNHLAVSTSWEAMLDGTYLHNLHSYEAL